MIILELSRLTDLSGGGQSPILSPRACSEGYGLAPSGPLMPVIYLNIHKPVVGL